MNFNSLPNETLQRIVDLCHEADEHYRKRMEARPAEEEATEKKHLKEWRGRSCSAMSMVNKTLRSLSAKYIFTTLRLSKIQASIFQFHLVKSPFARHITRLVFDSKSLPPPTSNAFILFGHFAGFLPNISAIAGLDDSMLKAIFGYTGLLPGPRLSVTGASSDYELQRKQNRTVFAQLAAQVSDLDLQVEAGQLEALLSYNFDGIKTLKVSSRFPKQPPVLQSPDSKFPSVLAECSQLKTLIIGQIGDDDELDPEEDDEIDPIHESFLELPYSFAPTLRSLTLDFPYSCYPTPFSEFRFAALFPSLAHLSITLRSLDLPTQANKIVLPSLTKLEIGSFYSIIAITALSKSLEIPSITTVRVVTPVYHALFSPSPEAAKTQAEAAATALNAYRSTLKSLAFVSHAVDPPRGLHRLFTLFGGSVAIDYNSKPLHEESRKLSARQAIDQQGRSTQSVRATPPLERYSPSTLVYDESMRILDWATDYVQKTKGKDKFGAKQLLGCLKPVEDFMEWMKE